MLLWPVGDLSLRAADVAQDVHSLETAATVGGGGLGPSLRTLGGRRRPGRDPTRDPPGRGRASARPRLPAGGTAPCSPGRAVLSLTLFFPDRPRRHTEPRTGGLPKSLNVTEGIL